MNTKMYLTIVALFIGSTGPAMAKNYDTNPGAERALCRERPELCSGQSAPAYQSRQVVTPPPFAAPIPPANVEEIKLQRSLRRAQEQRDMIPNKIVEWAARKNLTVTSLTVQLEGAVAQTGCRYHFEICEAGPTSDFGYRCMDEIPAYGTLSDGSSCKFVAVACQMRNTYDGPLYLDFVNSVHGNCQK